MGEVPLCPPAAEADSAAKRPTIGQILRRYGPAFRAKYAARLGSHC